MRLCGQVAIISKGRLVAFESVAELRAGMRGALPGVEQGQRSTFAVTFLAILRAGSCQELTQEPSWLT